MSKMYSTAEVARILGISQRTLFRWLYAQKIPEPDQKLGSGTTAPYLWTEAELNLAKAYKAEHYGKRS